MLASGFGAGDILDGYYAAFKLPDLIFNTLILGALSVAFIPVFIELKNGKGVVSCWMDVNDEPYSERLSIKLDYLYRDDVSVGVRIFEKT